MKKETERDVVEALQRCVEAMQMQLDRARGSTHITSQAATHIFLEAMELARKAVHRSGTMPKMDVRLNQHDALRAVAEAARELQPLLPSSSATRALRLALAELDKVKA